MHLIDNLLKAFENVCFLEHTGHSECVDTAMTLVAVALWVLCHSVCVCFGWLTPAVLTGSGSQQVRAEANAVLALSDLRGYCC